MSLSAHDSYLYFLEIFGEPTLVNVRVILLVEDAKIDEYLHPIQNWKLLGFEWLTCVYTYGHGCNMHQQVDGLSHRNTKIWQAFRLTVPIFEKKKKKLGEPTLVDVRVILFVEDDKMDEYIHPHTELETLRAQMVYMVMDNMVILSPLPNKDT
jgi:hypothetical protein